MASSEYGYGEGLNRGWRRYRLALLGSLLCHVYLLGNWGPTPAPSRVLLHVRLPDLPLAPQAQTSPQAKAMVTPQSARETARKTRPTVAAPERAASQFSDDFIQSGTDSPALRTYRLALAQALAEEKNYWPTAWRQSYVGLRLAMTEQGRVRQVTVSVSSGRRAWDQALRESVIRAARQAPLPDGLRGQAFVVELGLWAE